MSEQQSWFNLRNVVKLMNIGCACTIIAIGILELIPNIIAFWSWMFFCYQMIFAVLILAAEMRLDFVLKYFRFLEGNLGKGWFLIFCGMWMIQGDGYIAGCCLVFCGFATIFILSFTSAGKEQ